MLAITAAWGACFIAIRWGLRDAPVLWFATLRALVAGAALAVLGWRRGLRFPRGAGSWLFISAMALLNVAVAFGAMFGGVAGLATGTAAVLANAQPLLIVLPAWGIYGERVGPRVAVALGAGFGGLLLVALPGGGGRGAALSLLAAAGITAGTLLARRVNVSDVVTVTTWHFIIGGAMLALTAALVEGVPDIRWTARFGGVLAFLGIAGTALPFLAWFREVLRSPLAQLTAWTFLVPVFGIAFGAALLDERPTAWSAVGLALVLGSLWIVGRHRDPEPLATQSPTTAASEKR